MLVGMDEQFDTTQMKEWISHATTFTCLLELAQGLWASAWIIVPLINQLNLDTWNLMHIVFVLIVTFCHSVTTNQLN